MHAPIGARFVQLMTRPPRSPLWQLSIYFVALLSLGWLAYSFIPGVGDILAGVPVGGSTGELRDLLAEPAPRADTFLWFDLRMVVVMIGTLLITIPFSWGYMAVRQHAGYEQSVVQTLVLLPVVVAAIMMVVQSSLALAFALGGVAAAVRFRNTLKDVADATYVFLAIGLGIASGTGSLTGALVMAALFSYVSILLWRCDYGLCPTHHHADPAADAPPAARRRLRGELLVNVPDGAARALIEEALAATTRRWKLSRASSSDAGSLRLHYTVQLKRSATEARFIEALTASEAAASGITFRPLTEAT